jgi:Flp pilus assembly protein TadD
MLSVPLWSQVVDKVSQSKNQTTSHFEQAENLANTKQYLEAIAEYRLALQETPDDEAALFGLAMTQSQAGQNSEAIQSYLSL